MMKMELESDKSVKIVGFWVSLFTQRVRWALKLKGIEYEYIEEDIFNKTPLLNHLNPIYGKVPILLHNGIPVLESPIIIEYIDQIWSNDPVLMPQDPYQRAHVRFWAKFADQKVLETTWLALCLEGENQERAVKLAIENLKKVEEMLKGKSFFGGDRIGYLDFIMGFIAYILPVFEEVAEVKIFDPSKFPNLAAWSSKFLSHPVVISEYLPSKAEIFTFYRWRRENLIPIYASYGTRIWDYVTN